MSKDPLDALPQNLDLTALSVSQLALLRREIDKHQANAKEREQQAVKAQVIGVLEAAGYTLADLPGLFPSPARSTPRSRAAYRHPTKSKTTWTGKGRKPQWMIDYLAEDGHSLEDLRIK